MNKFLVKPQTTRSYKFSIVRVIKPRESEKGSRVKGFKSKLMVVEILIELHDSVECFEG